MLMPTIEDMEKIRKWWENNKEICSSNKKINLFGYDIKTKIYPPLDSEKSYVWVIKRADGLPPYWEPKEVTAWKDALQESTSDPNFIIFVWGGYSIKRISKTLITFL